MIRVFNRYISIKTLSVLFMEGLLIVFAYLLAMEVTYASTQGVVIDVNVLTKILIMILIFQCTFYYHDMYDFSKKESSQATLSKILHALGISTIIIAVVYKVFPALTINKEIFYFFLLNFVLLLLFNRLVVSKWYFRTRVWGNNILIIGSGYLADKITMEIKQRKDSGYRIVGYVDFKNGDGRDIGKTPFRNTFVIKDNEQLFELVRDKSIDMVVLALSDRRGQMPLNALIRCKLKGVQIVDVFSLLETLTGKIIIHELNPSWFIFSDGFKKSTLLKCLKRTFDILLSLSMLLFLSPLLIAVAGIIKLTSPGPVLYKQVRVGLNGCEYVLCKFRSMVNGAELKSGPVWAQQNDNRITKFGSFMRKSRIDELPQLVNVLIGDMSFVGPRPERPHFVKQLDEMIPYYTHRLEVKPGLTGWAQVKYNYGSSVEDAIEKLQLDLYYIKNMSVLLDFSIVLETAKVVITAKGT